MANEINIQAALTCQRFAPAVLVGAGSMDVNQNNATKRSSSQFQSLADTTVTEMSAGSVPATEYGCIFIKNLNTDAKTVTVSVGASSGAVTPFAKLSAGQFCLIPVNKGHTSGHEIYLQASAGTVDLLVVVSEY